MSTNSSISPALTIFRVFLGEFFVELSREFSVIERANVEVLAFGREDFRNSFANEFSMLDHRIKPP
jgi:hypothetical protein